MSSASATSLVDTPLVRSLLTIHCLTTYKEACQRGEVAIGKMLVVETNQLHRPTYVINFATKKQWRAPSQLSYIDAGLVDLVVPMCCIALIMAPESNMTRVEPAAATTLDKSSSVGKFEFAWRPRKNRTIASSIFTTAQFRLPTG
jgi:hypothetical protein